jgi:hypothetical protein
MASNVLDHNCFSRCGLFLYDDANIEVTRNQFSNRSAPIYFTNVSNLVLKDNCVREVSGGRPFSFSRTTGMAEGNTWYTTTRTGIIDLPLSYDAPYSN